MSQPNLTTHLLSHSPAAFKSATQHNFLETAGQLTLSRHDLLSWLLQDRLYALNYPTFIGSLLSKCTLPSTPSRTETLEWRITNLLIDSLTNIRRELGMFEDVLRQEFNWGKDGEAQEEIARQETRAYADVFAGAAAPGRSLFEGMVVLWATEKCYLEAWRYVQSLPPTENRKWIERQGIADVLRNTLIPNWTCPEFVDFVDTIGRLVNEMGAQFQQGGREWKAAEAAWRQVLWAEEKFWPEYLEPDEDF